MPEAPSDGSAYGRLNAAWTQVLPLTGGTLSGGISAPNITASSGGMTSGAAFGNPSLGLRDTGSGMYKYFRVNPQGGLEFVNNAFSAVISTLDDNGNFHAAAASFSAINIGGDGNFTGSIYGSTFTANGSSYYTVATSGSNCHYWFQSSPGTNAAVFYWERASGNSVLSNHVNGQNLQLASDGIHCSSNITGRAYYSKNGASGSAVGPNAFNYYWNGANLYGYVDDVQLGFVNFSSDYRIKKDVTKLPSMWGTVKDLNPIKYTHKDFTPPSAKEEQSKIGTPFFIGDDIERWGFIAHELQETLTESAASAVKDAPDALQALNPWTVIAALTKALQEAMARIEALERG